MSCSTCDAINAAILAKAKAVADALLAMTGFSPKWPHDASATVDTRLNLDTAPELVVPHVDQRSDAQIGPFDVGGDVDFPHCQEFKQLLARGADLNAMATQSVKRIRALQDGKAND
jgi:hypothetical protein